jgi:hypothetical protein
MRFCIARQAGEGIEVAESGGFARFYGKNYWL